MDPLIENVLCNLGVITISHGDPTLREELENVHFATCLLSDILSSSMSSILNIPGDLSRYHGSFGPSQLIVRNMRADNWCIHTVERITRGFTYSLQAYAYALGTCRTKQEHKGCRIGYCFAIQADKASEMRHLDCSSAACDILEAPIDSIAEALQDGVIPLMEVRFKDRKNTDPYLVVKRADGKTPYIAISHVWADGLGTSEANCIPVCQLRGLLHPLYQIQDDINVMDKGSSTGIAPIMPFWLDVLCISVDIRYQNLRDFSIRKMHDIYQQAHCVLALDLDFARMTRRNTPPYEIMTKVVMSGWLTRLWTFQEGVLPQSLYLGVNDGCLNLDAEYQNLFLGDQEELNMPGFVADCLDYGSSSLLFESCPRKLA